MYIFNNSGSSQTWVGAVIADQTYQEVTTSETALWARNDTLLTAIGAGEAVVSKSEDSSGHLGISQGIDYLKGNLPSVVESTNYPFASKVLADGKKLYRRVHGISAAVTTTQSSHKFTVPYTSCKITGIEVVNAEAGDFVDFHVLDTTTGTVTTIPNYSLNQFGFNTYLAAGYHRDISNYDADLFAGLQIEVKYTSISSKNVYINLILHEVKS